MCKNQIESNVSSDHQIQMNRENIDNQYNSSGSEMVNLDIGRKCNNNSFSPDQVINIIILLSYLI